MKKMTKRQRQQKEQRDLVQSLLAKIPRDTSVVTRVRRDLAKLGLRPRTRLAVYRSAIAFDSLTPNY